MDLRETREREISKARKITWGMIWNWIALFHRIVYILLFLALGFAIPIKNRTATWVIGFLVINWAAELRFWAKLKRIVKERHRQNLLLFTGLYFVYLMGLLYTSNMEYARFDIQVKLSLLVFPILFATIDGWIFSFLRINYIFLTYIAGCLAATIVCLTSAMIRYGDTCDSGVFFYIQLSLFHHPSYLAMFVNFAIVLIVFLTYDNFHLFKRWQLLLITLLLVFFNLMVVLLSSKMGIISLIVIYLLMAFIFFYRQSSPKKAIYPLVMLSTVVLFIWLFPQTMERLETTTKTVKNIEAIQPDMKESTGSRILVWQSGWQIIQDHPFFGVGTGDVKDALLEVYSHQGIKYAYSRRLNAHNQYLQTYLSVGLIGFLVLVAMLVWPGILAFRRKNYIYFFFILLVSMNILVESMFECQAGIVFYAFFNALLFWYSSIDKPMEQASN
ncbi:MAG: O-antigen ligase family protein [Bacteroidales bacterium]|nr:O-antigen ligase family protein [Bacteroidales bacterium]